MQSAVSLSVYSATLIPVSLRQPNLNSQLFKSQPSACCWTSPAGVYYLHRETSRKLPCGKCRTLLPEETERPCHSVSPNHYGRRRSGWKVSASTKNALGPTASSVDHGENVETPDAKRARASVASDDEAQGIPTAESANLGLIQNERGVEFYLGPSFYRAQSCLSRDLSVLAAALYKREVGQLRVLDVMSGSGVRALRYLRQGGADFVWANDASLDTHRALAQNLAGDGHDKNHATADRGKGGSEGGEEEAGKAGAYGAMP